MLGSGIGAMASARIAATFNRPVAGSVPIAVPLALPRQDLSIVMHLESPATRRSPPSAHFTLIGR